MCVFQEFLLFQLLKVDLLLQHKALFINRSIKDSCLAHHQISYIFLKEMPIIKLKFAKIKQLRTIYDGQQCISLQKLAKLIRLILLQLLEEKLDRYTKNLWLPDHLSLQSQCLKLSWEHFLWPLCIMMCFYWWIPERE